MIEKFEYSISTIRNLFHPFKYLEEDNFRLKYISTSSSMVEPGSLFVPLKGNRDGHEFIQDALGKGAISFLCEFNHPVLNSLPIEQQKKAILVDDTLLALGTLAEYHRKRFNPFVIGITGSSGKTTTKEFYKSCLNYFAEDLVFTEKNYNNEIGVPFTLFKISDNTRIVICEMGMNHRYEISRLTKMVKPNISVITNVGPAHIENLGSIKEIARAKAEILESMSKGSNLYIPENIEQIRIIRKKAKKYKVNVNTYSIENSKELKILEESNAGYLIEILGEKKEWSIPSTGILLNLSGVLKSLVKSKFSISKLREGILNFTFKDKRNVIFRGKYNIYDDSYNANPDSMKSSLETLFKLSGPSNSVAILGDMKELGKFSKKYHKELGEFAANLKLKYLITFGKESEEISKSFREKMGSNNSIHFLNDEKGKIELIQFIERTCNQNDFILVKGSRSMKMEEIVEELKKNE